MMRSSPASFLRHHYTLLILTLTYTIAFIDRQILAIAQEAIKAELQLSDTQLGLLTGLAFALFYATLGIPVARLADRYNRRNLLTYALSLWSLMTALTAFAQNYLYLFLARIGVGVGESGANPPSYSIIADIYPLEKRATALSLYTTGSNIGLLIGFLFGGWITQTYGWRTAFLVAGLPGILLALVLRTTLTEPPRGHSHHQVKQEGISLVEGLRFLTARVTLRWLVPAVCLGTLVSYSAMAWMAPFYLRSYAMDMTTVGTILALMFGVGGALGTSLSGLLADRLATRDLRWYLWLPALMNLISAPLLIFGITANSAVGSILLLLFPFAFGAMFYGVSLTVINTIAPPNLRATASALYLLLANIFGVGLGSLAVGMLSDFYVEAFGVLSLRIALVSVLPTAAVLSAFTFYMASRTIIRDLQVKFGQ